MSTSSTAQYGARPGVGVAGTVVGVALGVGDGDRAGAGVAVLVGLAGAAVMVACGVDVAVTGGGAQLKMYDAARAMRR